MPKERKAREMPLRTGSEAEAQSGVTLSGSTGGGKYVQLNPSSAQGGNVNISGSIEADEISAANWVRLEADAHLRGVLAGPLTPKLFFVVGVPPDLDPQSGVPYDNGSLAIRADGAAATFLYGRIGGAWVAIA